MIVEELFTKWGFKIEGAPLQKLEKSLDELVSKATIATGAFAALGVGIFEIAHKTAEAGDEAYKLSQKLGIGVENLQRLQFAAKLADVDTASFAQGMKFLAKGLDEAKHGSGELKEAFAKLKLNPKAFATSDEALRALADKFQKMPDGVQKTALAVKLFSRAGTDMIPLLNGGSAGLEEAAAKADKYGIVLTRAQAEAGEKFNDTLTETKAALTGLRNILGNYLIPIIQRYIEYFNDLIAENSELIAQKLQAFFVTFGKVLEIVFKSMVKGIALVQRMASAFGGMGGILDRINGALDFVLGNPEFLSILGATTIAVLGLAAAFTAVDAAALLIPLSIAALIGAVALLADDLVAYGQGRDSAFGLLINFFKKEFPTLTGFVSGAVDGMVAAFKIWFNILSVVYQILKDIGSYIVDVLVSAFDKIGKAISFLSEKLGLTSLLTQLKEGFKGAGGLVVSGLQGAAGVTGQIAQNYGGLGALGVTPSNAPVAGPSTSSQNQNITANMPITINVPPGADPAQVSAAASSGVHEGFTRSLRETKRTVKAGVKY